MSNNHLTWEILNIFNLKIKTFVYFYFCLVHIPIQLFLCVRPRRMWIFEDFKTARRKDFQVTRPMTCFTSFKLKCNFLFMSQIYLLRTDLFVTLILSDFYTIFSIFVFATWNFAKKLFRLNKWLCVFVLSNDFPNCFFRFLKPSDSFLLDSSSFQKWMNERLEGHSHSITGSKSCLSTCILLHCSVEFWHV